MQLQKLQKNDRVVLGEYISHKAKDGKVSTDELWWIPLYCTTSRALLTTRDAIGYNKSYMRWSNNEIRSWLNTVFLTEAFNEKERGIILYTKITGDEYSGWTHNIGEEFDEDLYDRIFLLSERDVYNYLSSYLDESFEYDELRQASATSFAKEQGVPYFYLTQYERGRRQFRAYGHLYPMDDKCTWGLRDSMRCIDHTGHFVYGTDRGYGVRPAIWIDMKMCIQKRDKDYFYPSGDLVSFVDSEGNPYRQEIIEEVDEPDLPF